MVSTSQESRLVELTRTLVGIPSINPVLSDDPALRGEHRMADFLEKYLQEAGFKVTREGRVSGRPNIVGRASGSAKSRRRLIIEAHLDTQGIHGMTVPPFDAVFRDGRIYGRGACDMKGPMAAALVNLTPERVKALVAAGIELCFVGAIGEETGNLGALELVDGGLGADEILVLEPTDLNIVHAHKGAFWFEIEIKGLAAHGSNPEKGLNAITAMGPVIDAVTRQVACSPARSTLLGLPTANIGTIRGGSSVNIVPDSCVIQVDRRTVPGEESRVILQELQASLESLRASRVIADYELRTIKEGVPFETVADTKLVRRLQQACERIGVATRAEGAAWYSDAGPFSRSCREVAVFGPGSIKQAHTVDEFIEIGELVKGARIIGDFLDLLSHEK